MKPAGLRYIGPRFESLESRCLLSLLPMSGGFSIDPYLPDKETLRPPPVFEGLPPTRDPADYPLPGSQPDGDDDDDSYESPTDSEQGGPIDLGGFTRPELETPGTKGNHDDSAAALAVLAGLSFVPRSDAAAAAAADAVFAALDAATTGGTEPQPLEGGAIGIASGPPAAPKAPPPAAAWEFWPQSPAQVEGVRGRFQAFEISTVAPRVPAIEEASPVDCGPPAPPDFPDFGTPLADEEVVDTPTVPLDAPDTAAATIEPEPEAESAFAALPLAIDERTGLLLNTVAAAILFAYLTRGVRWEPTDGDRQEPAVLGPGFPQAG